MKETHLVFLHQDTNIYLCDSASECLYSMLWHGNQLIILDVTQKALIYILFTQ